MKKKIDDCIELLQNADPTGEIQPDTQELLELEDQCYMMGPLIDTKLQKIDQKHAVLEDLNLKILEAFQVYNNLMKESISKNTNMIYSVSTLNQLNSLGPQHQLQQQQQQSMVNPAAGISYAAAPPSIDSMMLANQLNSLANGGLPQQQQGFPSMQQNHQQGYQLDPNQQQQLQQQQQMLQQMSQPNQFQLPNGQQQMQQQLYNTNNIVPNKLDATLTHSTSGGQFNYATPYQN